MAARAVAVEPELAQLRAALLPGQPQVHVRNRNLLPLPNVPHRVHHEAGGVAGPLGGVDVGVVRDAGECTEVGGLVQDKAALGQLDGAVKVGHFSDAVFVLCSLAR